MPPAGGKLIPRAAGRQRVFATANDRAGSGCGDGRDEGAATRDERGGGDGGRRTRARRRDGGRGRAAYLDLWERQSSTRRCTGRPPCARGARPPPRWRVAAAPRRRAEPADLPPRRGALGLRPGAARGAAGGQPELSLGRRRSGSTARRSAGLDQIEVAARDRRAAAGDASRGSRSGSAIPTAARSTDPPAIWQAGCSRLLDYGARRRRRPEGPPVLVVPSLINRPYILDLAPGRSHAALAGGAGLPAAARSTGGRRGRPRRGSTSRPTAPSGCCRRSAGRGGSPGGRCRSWATAWAARSRSGSRRGVPDDGRGAGDHRRALGLRLDRGHRRRLPAAIRAEAAGAPSGCSRAWARPSAWCRSSVFQSLFALVNPMQAALKFQKLARLDPDGPAARLFVALEDWLADGVPMPVGRGAGPARSAGRSATGRRPGGGASSAARSIRGRVAAPALVFCGETRQHRAAGAGAAAGRGAAAGARSLRPAHRARRDDRRQRRARPRSGGRWRVSRASGRCAILG